MAAMQYTGDGGFLFGIPARDLTADEVDALTDAQRAMVRASPLYRTAAPKGEKAAPDATKGDTKK